MSFNYFEFEQFSKQINTLEKQFDKWLYSFLMEEGMRFIREVKLRTPVDTGDLRNHWKLDGITRTGDTLEVWFVNSMHYATYVEYGHAKPYKAGAKEGSADWVDGYFMMTVSLDIINSKMPARFNRQFKAFLSSLEVR